MDIELERSGVIGNSVSDVRFGQALGCVTGLVGDLRSDDLMTQPKVMSGSLAVVVDDVLRLLTLS